MELAKQITSTYKLSMDLSTVFKRLKSAFCIFFLTSGLVLAADKNLINLGRWNNPELTKIITTASQIDAPGKRIVALSGHFLETPYVGNTLVGDAQTTEQLVINLAGFDCFTLLDVVEGLRRSSNFDDFPDQLRQVRYRDGRVAYENRRHFFSDWVAGDTVMVEDVTAAVGQGRSQVVVKQLNLKSDGTHWLQGIPVQRRDMIYIPTNQLNSDVLSALQEGDYVGIYSEHAGLDVSHTGLLVKGKDGFMLRHASSRNSARRVVDDGFLDYLRGKPGLLVYRAR